MPCDQINLLWDMLLFFAMMALKKGRAEALNQPSINEDLFDIGYAFSVKVCRFMVDPASFGLNTHI